MRKMASIAKRDIDKYIKFFCIKAAQTIIQSRSGEKLATRCNPETIGVDWFNIALPNGVIVSEVQNEIKSLYGRNCPAVRDAFFIDVILRTAEGLDMLVETWSVFATEKVDTNVKVCFTVYNKLAVLLKTLLSFTRALPAYRVSRRRGKDFKFLYKIYSGSRQSGTYEDLTEQNTIGSVGTPFYTVSIAVTYREAIHIDTHQMAYHSSSTLKRPDIDRSKEHLHVTETTTQGIVDQIAKAVSEDVTSNATSIPSCFSPPSSTPGTNSLWMSGELKDAIGEIEFIERTPSVSNLSLEQSSSLGSLQRSSFSVPTINYRHDSKQPGLESLDTAVVNIGQNLPQSRLKGNHEDGFVTTGYYTLAAFADLPAVNDSISSIPVLPSTPPLLSCLEEKMTGKGESVEVDGSNVEDRSSGSSAEGQLQENNPKPEHAHSVSQVLEDGQPQAHAVGFEDDFVLVELRPAFSGREGEAASLFRDTQKPPLLNMFASKPSTTDGEGRTLQDILDSYEEEFQKFDNLFRKLGYLNVN